MTDVLKYTEQAPSATSAISIASSTDAPAPPRIITVVVSESISVQGTGTETRVQREVLAPAQRTYPHLFDAEQPTGEAVEHVKQAHEDARAALAAFGEGEIEDIATRIALVSVAMLKAHAVAGFNGAFSVACNFIRRSCLTMESDTISRGQLNALVAAIGALEDNPMLTLTESVELTEKLTAEGWNGDNPLARKLIDVLLSEAALEEPEKQATLPLE